MSKIEWTDISLNPGIYGCSEESPACANCYAAKMAHRLVAMGVYPAGITKKTAAGIHWSGKVIVDYDQIDKAFSKLPKRKPARVFVTSMADMFHPKVPFEFISRVFDAMNDRRHLTFQVLTKHPQRMAEFWAWESSDGGDGIRYHWPSNVWAGCTVEDQKRADERVPWLLKVPATVRFLSCEPLLGPVDLSPWLGRCEDWSRFIGPCGCTEQRDPWTRCGDCENAGWEPPQLDGISWVITGGESGPKARPSNPRWFRDIRDQCEAADVAYLHKQNGIWAVPESMEWHPTDPADGYPAAFDGAVIRVGKKAAGRHLDGRTHDAFPVPR